MRNNCRNLQTEKGGVLHLASENSSLPTWRGGCKSLGAGQPGRKARMRAAGEGVN
jgi:hypothetical protein